MLSRYSTWLKNIAISAIVLILITVLVITISLVVVSQVRSTEPYQYSVDLALQSPEVLMALGEPVTVGRFAQGSVNTSEGGEAQLYIPLRGTYQEATIRVNGTKRDGVWKYWAIRVDTAEGEHLNLLEP